MRRFLHGLLFRAGRAASALSSLLYHAAAGCVRLADLRLALEREWSDEPSLFAESYVYSGLFDWEESIYRRVLRPGDRILVVGCGAGRDLVSLLERGHVVDGLDAAPRCAEAARAAARQRGFEARVTAGAIEDAPLDGPWDVVVFSWFCYSYIPESRRRVAALRRVRERLAPGGRVVISYVGRDDGRRRWLIDITRAVARLTGSDWRPERGDVLTPARTGRYVSHFERQFWPPEIEAEAHAAGLEVVIHEQGRENVLVLTEGSPARRA